MKKLFVLMAALSLLFLASCQQSECVDPQDGLTNEQDNPSGFKLLGDPRDPAEFMSSEELEMIQTAFKNMEGKTLKNEVIVMPGSRAGSVTPMGPMYILQEDEIPVANINGKYLYIKLMMSYFKASNTFNTSVSYRLGKDSATYSEGWYTENNTDVYIMGDKKMLLEYGVHFEVLLNDHPQYKKAILTFMDPIQMAWDQRPGYEQTCEAQIVPQRIKITYQ